MDLFSIKTIKSMLQAQGTKPRKGLGQNFLTSREVLGDILKAAELKRSDTVLEIGPGVGTLTRGLAQSAKNVIAVEKDPAMVQILKETTKGLPNVEIIQGDILKQNLASLSYPHLNRAKVYKVVANLPYYITSPVIRLFLENIEVKPQSMVLMVQKEVAQRICARPRTRTSSVRGRPPMNLLAVSVQFYAKPEIVSYVKKSCFWPQPKVDSAILRIAPLINADKKLINTDTFFKIVKSGFKQPRKQLLNNLFQNISPDMLVLDTKCLTAKEKRRWVEQWLKQNNIQPTQRAETLSVEDWINLAKSATI